MAENGSASDAPLFPSYDIDITPILVGIITLIAIAIAILFTLIPVNIQQRLTLHSLFGG